MPRLARLDPHTATAASRDVLTDLVSRHGQIGDMVATMAHSPAVLTGYLQLSRALKRAKLNRKVSELISIAVRTQQGCGLCLESHVSAAFALRIDDEEIDRARAGTSANPGVAAMIALGLQVYREPRSITDEQILALYDHGYSDREITDVVGVVSLNILTGAFNLLAGLTPHRPPPAVGPKPPIRLRIPAGPRMERTRTMRLFAIRDYRHLFSAQVIALFGTGLATVALALLA